MKKSLLLNYLFTCCLILITVKGFSQSPGEFVPCQEIPNLMQSYNADSRQLNHFYTPVAGDGLRGGGFAGGNRGSETSASDSPEKRARLNKLDLEYLDKLSKLNFKNLPQECKVDYILFKRELDRKVGLAAKQNTQYNKVADWFPFADKLYDLEKLRRRGHQPDAEKVAKDWSDISKQIKTLQTKLRDINNLDMESVETATNIAANLKLTSASIYNFYNGYDPMFTWWVPKTYTDLDETLTAYGNAFKSKLSNFKAVDKSGIVGTPVGREELIRMLKYEMVDYTPEELIDIANKEFAWCDAEMLKASKEMGFGTDWKAALEKVKNSYVPAGKQPEMILGLYNQSVDFLKKNNLLTIPPIADETWLMIMMTPERQLVNPFFTGGTDISISYPTNTMSEDDRLMSMRGNNPHLSRATVHHELIAGHNLQYNSNARYRTYRNFGSGFWTEGWSLYWELILWDMKFPKSPEDKIGMLFWHMHRCARIIFSLNYHMGKWTPQQCVDFLVDRVGHERANAAGEVRRSFEGHYDPLYQAAYLVGGREFYALKHELVDSKKMTYKQYHDAVMHLNAMPVEMVRAILTNQPLDKDYTTKWRFYDNLAISANN